MKRPASDIEGLRQAVERHAAAREPSAAARDTALELLTWLERGMVRAAEPVEGSGGSTGWRVNGWVKEGILLAFRTGIIVPSSAGMFAFQDKDTVPPRAGGFPSDVRIVPGGTAIRRGAYIGPRVTIMPPAYVNVGAYVDEGSMVDSHALVGSCAQVGRNVHLSAAAQVGGVLEPIGALPVVVEDHAFVGGGVGIYEGVRVGARAVLGAGVVLTGSSAIFDLVHGRVLRRGVEAPLHVPAGAVVVPGTRRIEGDFARVHGLSIAAAIIVKYRDASTDARTALEEALR